MGERCPLPVIDVHPVWRCGRYLVTIQHIENARDDRPCVRLLGCFAGQIPGLKLGDSDVHSVEIERDVRHDLFFAINFGDTEYLGVKRLGSLISA